MRTFNLLRVGWIPVRCMSGKLRWIAPYQIVDPDDPPERIDSGRPDFDGALIQFFIALLQTAAAPADKAAWRSWMKSPPSMDVLRKVFEVHEEAFWLDGPGPRYMQELNFPLVEEASEEKKGKPKPPKALEPCPIAWLLMDAPTDNAIELNKDFFVKRDRVECLGLPAVAMALTVLQMNASGGGPGYRTSLRGGGPLTTLVDVDRAPLWMRLWLNVLTSEQFLSKGGDASLTRPEHLFPWMGPTRTSKDEKGVTTTEHVHPAHQFWAMPWRIRIDFQQEEGSCSLLDSTSGPVVRRFYKRNYGFNYKGEWRHPLTPYISTKKGSFSRTVGEDGVPYREWPALTLGGETPGGDRQLPARVVEAFRDEQRSAVHPDLKDRKRIQLRAFGYEMDNAKARCWFERTTPLFDVEASVAGDLYQYSSMLIRGAQDVLYTLRQQVKRAVKRRPEDAKKEIPEISQSFWAETEDAFFDACSKLASGPSEDQLAELREQWLNHIHKAALRIFERHSQESAVFSAADVRRVAEAHNALRSFTHPNGKKLRELVGLPPIEKEPEDKAPVKKSRTRKGKG